MPTYSLYRQAEAFSLIPIFCMPQNKYYFSFNLKLAHNKIIACAGIPIIKTSHTFFEIKDKYIINKILQRRKEMITKLILYLPQTEFKTNKTTSTAGKAYTYVIHAEKSNSIRKSFKITNPIVAMRTIPITD